VLPLATSSFQKVATDLGLPDLSRECVVAVQIKAQTSPSSSAGCKIDLVHTLVDHMT